MPSDNVDKRLFGIIQSYYDLNANLFKKHDNT